MLFQEMPIDPRVLASALVFDLPKIAADAGNSDRDWTSAIRTILDQLRSVGKGDPENRDVLRDWLLDFMWYLKAQGGIEIALESEWKGCQDVLDDFEKLMYVKAPLKVMLYCVNDRDRNGQPLRQKLEEYMTRFPWHLQGENYLLIEYQAYRGVAYCLTIPRDGRQELRFERMDLGKAGGAAA